MSEATHERIAIVTGAARGMGAAIGRTLALHRWTVLLTDADQTGAEETAAQVRAAGGAAEAVGLDVTQPDAVHAVVTEAASQYGGIAALVNAAGAYRPRVATTDLPLETWDLVLSTNLTGSFLTTQAVLPYMLDSGAGAIVNIASNAARSTATSLGAEYTAAKTGLLGLTRHVAREVASDGIRVNAVAPGPVRGARLSDLEGDAGMAAIAEAIPMGRLGEPEEVAAVVEFLLSDRASFITGATLDVNGGIVMA